METWYDTNESDAQARAVHFQTHNEDRTLNDAGKAGANTRYKPSVARLKSRLEEDRVTRLALLFLDKYEGVHLKDQSVRWMDDRRRMSIDGCEVVNFGSDSFLGLDQDPRVKESIQEATQIWGSHNGSSRAFTSVELCELAERKLANWLDVEDTLIFPSVTLANAGLLPALAGKNDLLVVDRQSHDSMQQAALIAAGNGARLVELNPCTAEALEAILSVEDFVGCVVAVDGVYSMTGDIPPLDELYEVARRDGATLYVDDAHGTGLVGPRGHGAAKMMLGSLDDVLMVGSLSKAFSCLGAFVTCDARLKRLLKIRSSTFIFGGPVPPPYLAAVCTVCDILQSPVWDDLINRLNGLIDQLTSGLRAMGVAYSGGESAIVSVTIGDLEETLKAGKWLFDRGYYAQSATYPAVPMMGGVLRIQVNANHSAEDIEGLLDALADLKTEFRLPAPIDSL